MKVYISIKSAPLLSDSPGSGLKGFLGCVTITQGQLQSQLYLKSGTVPWQRLLIYALENQFTRKELLRVTSEQDYCYESSCECAILIKGTENDSAHTLCDKMK